MQIRSIICHTSNNLLPWDLCVHILRSLLCHWLRTFPSERRGFIVSPGLPAPVGNRGQDCSAHFSFCYLACQIKGQKMMKKPQNSPGLADFPPSFVMEFGT